MCIKHESFMSTQLSIGNLRKHPYKDPIEQFLFAYGDPNYSIHTGGLTKIVIHNSLWASNHSQ